MAFSSSKDYRVSFSHVRGIANEVLEALESEGYSVNSEEMAASPEGKRGHGDIVLSVTKGGFFKMVAGLKTALKCTFSETEQGFRLSQKIGLFESQAVPTTIMLVAFWPLIVTQIVGLVKSKKLDSHIFELVDQSIQSRVD